MNMASKSAATDGGYKTTIIKCNALYDGCFAVVFSCIVNVTVTKN